MKRSPKRTIVLRHVWMVFLAAFAHKNVRILQAHVFPRFAVETWQTEYGIVYDVPLKMTLLLKIIRFNVFVP